MIELKVEKICETCPNFEATTATSYLYADGGPVAAVHTVTCANVEVCRSIRRFMETALADEGKKNASDA